MPYREAGCGLVVPVEPVAPKRQRGPLELGDSSNREQAVKVLSDLWDVMGLSGSGRYGAKGVQELRRQMYRLIGEALLGSDCPEKEQLT